MEARRGGLAVELDYNGRSLKTQMREAARLGARFTALLGEEELQENEVTLRNMTSGEQARARREEAVARLQGLLNAGGDR